MRLRLVIAIGLAVVLAGVGGVEAAWARTTPLTNGSTDIGVRVCPDPAHDAGCDIREPLPGEAFEFGFSVQNRRSLPLTISGIRLVGPSSVAVESLRMIPEESHDMALDATIPFAPFVLGEGQERTIVIVARGSPCLMVGSGGGFMIDQAIVEFHWLAITQTQSIRFRQFIRHELRFPWSGGPCP